MSPAFLYSLNREEAFPPSPSFREIMGFLPAIQARITLLLFRQ